MQEKGRWEPSGVEEASGCTEKSHLPVAGSIFYFLTHMRQRYSPTPRTSRTITAAPRRPRSGVSMVFPLESASLTKREESSHRRIHIPAAKGRERAERSKGSSCVFTSPGSSCTHSGQQERTGRQELGDKGQRGSESVSRGACGSGSVLNVM